jgi:anti-sigma factor RsiW
MDHQQAIGTHAVERYLLDEMGAADRDAFEEHYFTCVDCADDVRISAAMRDGVKAGLAVPAPAAADRPAQVVSISSRRPWRTSVLLPWAAAASLAIVAGYQTMRVAPGFEGDSSIQAVTPITLRPASRGAIVTVSRPTGGVVAFALELGAVDSAAALTYDLRTVDDKSVASGVIAAPPAGTPLLLLVPSAKIDSPGGYVLRVRDAGAEPPVAEYRFAVAER